jgi:hypothetical protein
MAAEKLVSLLTDWAKEKVKNQEDVIALLKRFGYERPQNNFESLYAHSLVTLRSDHKEQLAALLRHEEVVAAFRRYWTTHEFEPFSHQFSTQLEALKRDYVMPDFDVDAELKGFTDTFRDLVRYVAAPTEGEQTAILIGLRDDVKALILGLQRAHGGRLDRGGQPTPNVAASGVGVIDTTSLWAAGSLIQDTYLDLRPGDIEFNHPYRQIDSTKKSYFLSFLHNLVLYDELRTDINILSSEDDWYGAPVSTLLNELSSDIKVDPIPQSFNDAQIIELVAPAFVEKTRAELRSRSSTFISRQLRAFDVQNFSSISYFRLKETADTLSGEVRKALVGLAKDDLTDERHGTFRSDEILPLVSGLSVVARTVRYAAHSRHVHTTEKRPSAFCASSGRIELLQDYFDTDYVKSLQSGAGDFVSLFSRLGLPKTGYDFSGFSARIKPISLSDLSHALSGLQPKEALDRVLQLRETAEAKELRRIWADRLWGRGQNALEGYRHGINATMANIEADGDGVQIIAVESESEVAVQEDVRARRENVAVAMKPETSSVRDLQRSINAKLKGLK